MNTEQQKDKRSESLKRKLILSDWMDREARGSSDVWMAETELVEGAMEEYASQQTAALKKQHREESVKLVNIVREAYQKDIESLQKQLEELQSLREENERIMKERDQFAMKFLEYASGVVTSNYRSSGTWYLEDGTLVSTARILEQFKALTSNKE